MKFNHEFRTLNRNLILLNSLGFVILVGGTIIYGQGDEAEVAQAIAEGYLVEEEEGVITQPIEPTRPIEGN